MQYGSQEHEEFAKRLERVRNDLATRLKAGSSVAAGVESNPKTRGLLNQIAEFQLLCENAKKTGIAMWEEKYQTQAKALAARLRYLDAKGGS